MLTSSLNALRSFLHGDGAALLPELELLLFAAGILAMDSWIAQKEKYWSPTLALAGTIFSGLTLWMLRARIFTGGDLSAFHEKVIVDSYFLFFATLSLAATALVILLSVHAPELSLACRARFYALLLLSCAAMMLMDSAVDLLVTFLAVELASVTCYFLAATPGLRGRPHPSSVKFLLSSAVGSAILAYGFSLLYGLSASTNIVQIASALARRHNVSNVITLSRQGGTYGSQMHQLLQSRLPEALHWHPAILETLPIAAFLLVFFGLLAKLKAAATHHVGSNAGSAAPISAVLYISGALVVATFASLLRMMLTIFADSQRTWWIIVAALAVALIASSVIASLRQKTFAGILAYSSLAQIGYLLLGLVSGDEAALTAITYYLFTYLFILTGAFAVLLGLRRHADGQGQLVNLDDLRERSLLVVLLLIFFVISLAGLPPTAGFFARYFLFRALLETGHRYIAWFAAFSALPLACSYLLVAIHAWRRSSVAASAPVSASLGAPEAVVLGVCVFVTLAAGLYSEPFMRLARYAFGQ
jgi:NADH-quinone oxidoreductase subunit N